MLHQIALHRRIPEIKEDIKGFIDETRGRLTDCADSAEAIKRRFGKQWSTAQHFPHVKKELAAISSLQSKYNHRLMNAEKALDALRNLQRCINE